MIRNEIEFLCLLWSTNINVIYIVILGSRVVVIIFYILLRERVNLM